MKLPARSAAALLLAPGLTATALAQGALEDKLRACAALPQEQRLDCFERLVPAAPPALQSAAPPPAPAPAPAAAAPAVSADVSEAIDRNIEPSYFGIGTGLRLKGDDSSRPLLYEAQIVKNLELTGEQNLLTTGWKWRLDLPLRFVVRQFDIDSKPVRTPSYNPGGRAYFYAAPKPDAGSVDVFSFGLFHYSNGQEGEPLWPDGQVNTTNGSFNTNYLELAWLHSRLGEPAGWLKDLRLSMRQHFYGSWDAAQVNQYPKRQFRGELRIAKQALTGLLPELRLALGYRAGYGWRSWNPATPENSVKLRTRDRFQLSVEVLNEFRFFGKTADDYGIYLRYDLGYDDYNINFGRRQNRVTVGFNARL